MPSGTIDTMLNNKPGYAWSLSGWGHDPNGSWTAINQSQTANAQVWINSANIVILQQTVGFGVNQLPATGSSNATTHQVPEPTWPKGELTWSPSAGTPSSITYRDMGQPTTHMVPSAASTLPPGHVFPGMASMFPSAASTLPPGHVPGTASMETFILVPGVGGRTRDLPQFFQKPSAVGARGWWAWTINLV
jgi:hypothetical protein